MSTTIGPVQHYDEYGNALDATASTTYGWLGANQRSSDTLSGYTLMGVRLYDPSTGRLLQVDPVVDGSPNHYGYPVDPVMRYDLNGQWWSVVWKILKCAGAITWVLGSTYFGWAKIRAIWRAVRSRGGIRATARWILSADQKSHRMRRVATALLTYSSVILGLDSVYENCAK